MLEFIWDLLRYPFDKEKEKNKFGAFLTTVLKDYPAFFFFNPSWKKILLFPFLVVYAIFRKK